MTTVAIRPSQQLQQQAANKNEITLRGSVDIITEFFHYALNNILYQRCIYPASLFGFEKKYGLSLMVTKDEKLQEYLTQVLSQLDKWLVAGHVSRLVLVFLSEKTKEAKERWTFHVEQEKSYSHPATSSSTSEQEDAPMSDANQNGPRPDQQHHPGQLQAQEPAQPPQLHRVKNKNTKSMQEITREIQSIMRQITASVSFLPVIDEIMAFDLLIYCDKQTTVPKSWEEELPSAYSLKESACQQVRLSSFSTSVHRVDSMVSYAMED
ncbi:unnamed protein product [Amoebophrya sp. A120]|nr:unnamed protein product [Amoebophrya sp. A120]|eukprot:GSA120T00020957001.1